MLRLINAILILAAGAVHGETYSGRVTVVDADTFWVGDTKVRLFAIDAQEKAQRCELADGRAWFCGEWATEEARAMYQGAWAVCTRAGPDSYDRVVARCRVDGADMGDRLVRAGLAEAAPTFSSEYVDAEKQAWFAARGIWRGRVQAPAEFRETGATAATLRAGTADCAIKGNLSRGGERIYHLPGQRDYARTRISELKGERWFCTEAEAIAAGWRRAMR